MIAKLRHDLVEQLQRFVRPLAWITLEQIDRSELDADVLRVLLACIQEILS